MNWLFFALLSRFLWAWCNALEQPIARAHKYLPTLSAFLLVTAVQLPLGVIILAHQGLGGVDFHLFLYLIMAGGLAMGGVYPFYMALARDDAHSVVPFFEFTPVFLTLLAVVYLGEQLGGVEIFGAALIIICGFLFSWDFKGGHVKGRTLLLMTLSSLMFALYQFALRYASDFTSAPIIAGVILCVNGSLALAALSVFSGVRRNIVNVIRQTKGGSVLVGAAVNIMSFMAICSLIKAFQLAPTTGQVAALSGSQPFFSFFVAVFLGVFAARYYARVAFDRETILKLGLIVGIVIGVYLLAGG